MTSLGVVQSGVAVVLCAGSCLADVSSHQRNESVASFAAARGQNRNASGEAPDVGSRGSLVGRSNLVVPVVQP